MERAGTFNEVVGTKGFFKYIPRIQFCVGGRWRFTMHGEDRGNYGNECEFTRIEKPNLIAWKRHSNPLFRVVASFEEVSVTKTKIVFKMLFDTVEECEKLKRFVVDKNEENFDRLEAELKRMSD